MTIRTWSLYGFILCLPLSIAFSQMCLAVLFITYIAEAVIRKRAALPHTPLNHMLFGYVAVTLLVTPFAFDVVRSLKGLDGMLTIGTFYLIHLSIRDLAQLKRVIRILVIIMSVAAIYGITQHYFEVDLFRLSRPVSFLKHVENDLSAPVRIPGFSSYMTFSGQLAMIIPLLCAWIVAGKEPLKKWGYGVALMLTSAALFWTYTRSAWLGAICALSTIGMVRSRKWWYIFVLLFLVLALVAVQPELLNSKLSVFRTKDVERLYTWESSVRIIWDHPLTGIGKGNYSNIVEQYRTPYQDFEFSSRAHAHNNLLQIAVEGGILSLFFFLGMWGIIFRTAVHTYQQIPEKQADLKMLSLGLIGSLIAFFVHGQFEYNVGDSEVAMMMWTLTALMFKLHEFTAPSYSSPNSSRH